jgi:predicted SAM-dependent methyltransferase
MVIVVVVGRKETVFQLQAADPILSSHVFASSVHLFSKELESFLSTCPSLAMKVSIDLLILMDLDSFFSGYSRFVPAK